MTRLSVNVNKLATLRNSRGKNLPDVAAFAQRILAYGAHGITVHPRPDGRHIRYADVFVLHELVERWNNEKDLHGEARIEFNIEGYPSDDFMALLEKVRPDQCTLVPDPPEALTSNAGWDLAGREGELSQVLARLHPAGLKVSLFVDPSNLHGEQVHALKRLKPARIELYTEAFADHFGQPNQEQVTQVYRQAAALARSFDVGVNAGHDLNQLNLGLLVSKIPWLHEVSIGHALMCEALEQGMATTIQNYLRILVPK